MFFFSRDNELQIYHDNVLLMDDKHGKLFVIRQRKACKFVPEMNRNTLGSQAPPGPAGGGAYSLPHTH